MCNRLYRQMNGPVAELIEPGMKWTDLLRASVHRGMYADAIGREERMDERSHPEPDEIPKPLRGRPRRGKWHSVSMHPTDLGGFVVTRADISERKKAEAAEREADALLQKISMPALFPTACRRSTAKRSIEIQPARRCTATGRKSRISTPTGMTGTGFVAALLVNGRIDDFRVRMHAADGSIFWVPYQDA